MFTKSKWSNLVNKLLAASDKLGILKICMKFWIGHRSFVSSPSQIPNLLIVSDRNVFWTDGPTSWTPIHLHRPALGKRLLHRPGSEWVWCRNWDVARVAPSGVCSGRRYCGRAHLDVRPRWGLNGGDAACSRAAEECWWDVEAPELASG